MPSKASKNSPTGALFPGALTVEEFDRLAASYRKETGLNLAAVDTQGVLLRGEVRCVAGPEEHREIFRQSVEEALRWGDPCIMCCPFGHALWSVPVMRNHQLLGGLLVGGVGLDEPEFSGAFDRRLLQASRALLDMAARNNLTNAALLAQNRLAAERESGRAEALHDAKERLYDNIRGIYLREEPALLAAIQRGERTEARRIINRILTAIYARGAGRGNLLKTLALELVVMMARAAVQAGASPKKFSASTTARSPNWPGCIRRRTFPAGYATCSSNCLTRWGARRIPAPRSWRARLTTWSAAMATNLAATRSRGRRAFPPATSPT